jgi:hypothetical protein
VVATALTPPRTLDEPRRVDVRLIIGAALFLVGAGGGAVVHSLADDTRSVLVAARDLPAGARLAPGDLAVAKVRVDDEMYGAAVPAVERDTYAGKQLNEPVHAHQLLTRAQLSTRSPLGPDQVALTIPVGADTAPQRVQPGVSVQVLATIDKGKPESQTFVVLQRAAVLTKVHRYAGSEVARNIIGQSCSTVDPKEWVRDGKIVLVDAAKSDVGEDTAALVGAALINLVALAVAEQGVLPERERRPVTLLVDEMQAMPGADYESILSELAKYGANIVLSTQSLARLDALDQEQGRALRPTIFSNVDGLFSFQVSAADSEYLAQELGGGLEQQDLLELGDFHCYARLNVDGERLPAFSVHLDPPPERDATLAETLAERSAQRYGRNREDVERDLRAALARIELARTKPPAESYLLPDANGPVGDGQSATGSKERNQNRRRKIRRSPQQPPLLGDGETAPDVWEPARERGGGEGAQTNVT